MKAFEIYKLKDELDELQDVSNLLRYEGLDYEATTIDKAIGTMDELMERLRDIVSYAN